MAYTGCFVWEVQAQKHTSNNRHGINKKALPYLGNRAKSKQFVKGRNIIVSGNEKFMSLYKYR
jgi:hypothetical protein